MHFSIQSVLENDQAILEPLTAQDFEVLYALASDPKVWEQHPDKDRWKKDQFINYFEGAMESKGAFKIIDKASGEVAGGTRFYEYNPEAKSIAIGYTFYATKFWGTGFNPSVKKLMLDYAFQFVDTVIFHIGATNFRSQIAIGRVGAVKVGEQSIAFNGGAPRLSFIYEIKKGDWEKI